MVDIDLLEQLVHAMEDAVGKLEGAFLKGDINYINRLRVFVFNVHQRVNAVLAEPINGVSDKSKLGGQLPVVPYGVQGSVTSGSQKSDFGGVPPIVSSGVQGSVTSGSQKSGLSGVPPIVSSGVQGSATQVSQKPGLGGENV